MRPFALALALFLAPAAAPAQTEAYQSIGWWEVFYSQDERGCAAVAQFDNDVVFVIGINTASGEAGLEVAIANPAWTSIVSGNEYEVTATFGRKSPWYLTMYGTQADTLYGLENLWPAESDSAGRFVDEFMASTNMRWVYAGTVLGDFSLKDSRRAFNAALECTEIYLGSGDAGSGGADPFAGPKSDPFR